MNVFILSIVVTVAAAQVAQETTVTGADGAFISKPRRTERLRPYHISHYGLQDVEESPLTCAKKKPRPG